MREIVGGIVSVFCACALACIAWLVWDMAINIWGQAHRFPVPLRVLWLMFASVVTIFAVGALGAVVVKVNDWRLK